MHAISIRQPWAWLIVHGYKDIENRTRNFKFRGRILIHTGKLPDRNIDQIRIAAQKHGISIPYQLQYGGIIGETEITEVIKKSKSPWFSGPYGLVLKNSKVYHSKIPCRGQLGIFKI